MLNIKKRVKIIILFLATLTATNAIFSQEIKFKNETCDFGIVQTGTSGECIFEFKNTGKAPLVITDVRGPAEWPKKPIKPRKSAVIKVKYDKSTPGAMHKMIVVLSNAKKQANTTLIIKGTIENQK